MIGKLSNSSIRTVALGATIQSSTYGQTIPVIYGRAKSALYLIWAANLRMGTSGKASKKSALFGPVFSKLFGLEGYLENVDFLVGHNPIIGALQFWVNQNQWLPLNFASYSVTSGFIGPSSITVPDPLFYSVIGVTVTQLYGANIPTFGGTPGTVTFDDYGGQGPQTYTGSYETPLWNTAMTGPNPTDPSSARYWPYVYNWLPGSDTIYLPAPSLGLWPEAGYTINIYYAQLDPSGASLYDKKASGTAVPIAALNMFFEQVLGSGDEYILDPSNPAHGQQIIYPHYAGMASVGLDLGTSNNIPNIQPEIQGSFGLYSTGDADFADMIEDVFNGSTQAGLLSTTPSTRLQHGLNCQSFPGCVQNVAVNGDPALVGAPAIASFPLPNTAGNFLVVAFATANGSISGITDGAGNTWTAAFVSPTGEYQLWTATANAYSTGGVGTTVTISYTWTGLPTLTFSLLEIAGVDTLASVVTNTAGNSASVTSSAASNSPAYLLGFACGITSLNVSGPATIPNWSIIQGAKQVTNTLVLYGRQVAYPGNYTLTVPATPFGHLPTTVALLLFTNSQPVSYPKPLGDILDHASLDLVRAQCRAAGLYGSLSMDSQKSGQDWLKDLYDAADAAPVWSGFKLKSIPWSEQSAVGNGIIYNAPTASGPLYIFKEADFVVDNIGQPPVTVDRTAQLNVPDLLQIQQPSRGSQYNDIVVSQPETAAIALYGPRKASPVDMRMFQDPAVGRMYLGILIRRQNYIRRTFNWKAPAKFWLYEAMDLVGIPLSSTMPNLNNSVPDIILPVRLTSVKLDGKYGVAIEAQDFIYGTNAPVPLPVTAQNNNFPQTGATPPNINPPVIFQPPARLGANEVWVLASNSDSNYGGCQVYVSVDGGLSYSNYGATIGNAITGYSTSDWPTAEDPDTTNDLALDLTESQGTLDQWTLAEENNFVPLAYVASTSANNGNFVQKAKASAHGVTSLNCAFTSNNASGNAAVVSIGVTYLVAIQPPPTVSVTDSAGNVYTIGAASPVTFGPGTTYQLWAFCAFDIAAGANTVTVHSNATVDLCVAIHEYAEVNALAALSSNSQTGSTGPLATGSALGPFNFDLVFTAAYDATSSSTNFNPSSQYAAREYVTQTAGGSGQSMATFDGPAAMENNVSYALTGAGDNVHCLALALTKVVHTPLAGVVQSTEGGAVGSITSATAVFEHDITSGSGIVVAVGTRCALSIPSLTITDTLGNVYQPVGSSPVNTYDFNSQALLYVTFGSSAGANTITATFGGTVLQIDINAHECVGITLAGMAPADGFAAVASSSFSAPPFPLTLTAGSVPGDIGNLLLGFCYTGDQGGGYYSNGQDYSQITQSDSVSGFSGGNMASFFQIADSPTSSSYELAVTNTRSGGANHGMFVMLASFRSGYQPLQPPYELMSYAVADMTAASQYTLKATGSGNQLRRAVYGVPAPNQGDDHPPGSRFAFVGQGAPGIIKLSFDTLYISQQLNFKFVAFNTFGGGQQSLSDIPAYGYWLDTTSLGGNQNTYNYSQSPADALTNPSSTSIAMSQVTVTFPSNAVNYNARTFTIPAPTMPTWYYVTIQDPGYLGDPDSTTDLAAQCQTSAALVGAPGYTYIGAILAEPTGGGTTVLPGGAPPVTSPTVVPLFADDETPAGLQNGSNQTYTLANPPNPTESLDLKYNGVTLLQGTDYTLSGATITLTNAKPNSGIGEWLKAWYRYVA